MADKVGLENVFCNFCNSDKYSLYDTSDSWNIVKCKDCGFCYTNPRPKLADLIKYYDESYFRDVRHSKKFYNSDGTVKASTENYHNRIESIESHCLKRGKLLEIGAARGGFLNIMKNRGWDVEGVEISKDAVGLAKELYQLDLFCGSFEEYSPNYKLDVICMYQTLEHVPNPRMIIEKVYQLLNPGGILIIEVPNINGYDIKRDKERKKLVFDLPRHLNHFSPSFLGKQLTILDYKIVEVDKYYPQFVLNLLSKRVKNKALLCNVDAKLVDNKKDVPMLKKSMSKKGILLKKMSNIFPGWRFTIVAKK